MNPDPNVSINIPFPLRPKLLEKVDYNIVKFADYTNKLAPLDRMVKNSYKL